MALPIIIFGAAILIYGREGSNILSDKTLLSRLFSQAFALSSSYFLPLLILSVTSPSRFGTMVARYFNIIFLLLAGGSLFSWLR